MAASDPYAPQRPVPGKPIVKTFPTPNLDDRIYVVRRDTRVGGFQMPAKGDPYDGADAQKLAGFMFATAVPSDQTGWMDFYYLNERANQNDYNYVIDYPYADKDYPQVTRTYVLLRSDVVEPEADDVDPVFNGEPNPDADVPIPVPDYALKLIDHKQLRLDDPILDTLFVGVQRTYQRLPSPIIRSYDQNEVKQIVTVDTQEVETENVPTSSALTEVLKVERGTTAKARVTTGTVPRIFPADRHEVTREDLTPPEFRGLLPTITESYIDAGDAILPTLTAGDLSRSQRQVTEFTREFSVTYRNPVTLPVSFFNKELGGLSQGRFGEGFTGVLRVTWTLAAGLQNIDGDLLTTEANVRDLGDGRSVKMVKKVEGGWPILRDRIVDDETGIAVNVTKKVIPVLTPLFAPIAAGYVDVHSYDKWRSIQITSKVDLDTLPGQETYPITTDISMPSTLVAVGAEWQPEEHFHASHSNVKFDETDDGSFIDKTNTTQIIVQSTIRGTIIVKLRNGYRGPARGRLVRTYLNGFPGIGSLPSITRIEPSSGMAFLKGTHYSDTKIVGFGVSTRDYQQSSTFDVAQIGPCLVGSYLVYNQNFNAIPVQVSASSKGFLEADEGIDAGFGTRVADNDVTNLVEYPLQNSIGGAGVLVVDIDASTPSALGTGTEILQSARTIRWRFGIVILELVYVTIP